MTDFDTEDMETMAVIDELDCIEPKSIDDVRQIVIDHSMKTFYWDKKSNKVLVDVATANAICQVYDNINGKHQKRIANDITASLDSFVQLSAMCWKILSKVKAK